MKRKLSLHLTGISIAVIFASCDPLPVDTVINSASIQTCGNAELNKFDFAVQNSMGLIVTDPLNGFITLAVADESHGGPWRPINGNKKMACGLLYAYNVEDGNGDEYDWNLNIIPDPAFAGIIQEAKIFSDSNCSWQKYFIINNQYVHIQCPKYINGRLLYDNRFTEAELRRFQNVEFFQAEVTPDEHFYNNKWFPADGNEGRSIVKGKKVGVYGPWVFDCGHGIRPEIHPCEVIWWKNTSQAADTLMILGVQDDANRFDEPDDFSGVSIPTANLWAHPPIKSIYKIPFEFDGRYQDHLVVTIKELESHNVVTRTIPGFGDSDNGSVHILKRKKSIADNSAITNNIIAEVREDPAAPLNTGVSFVEICKRPNGNIVGYIQIKTAYGKNNGNEGYQLLRVTINKPVIKLTNQETSTH